MRPKRLDTCPEPLLRTQKRDGVMNPEGFAPENPVERAL